MNILNFQLVTPEKTVLTQELSSLTCPTTLGEITILPGHAPLVANLVPGELRAKSVNGDSSIFVAGGFVQVKADGMVVVLADDAQHSSEIDAAAAEQAKIRAQKAMEESRMNSEEFARASAALQQSLARMHVARKHAHRNSPLADRGTYTE